MARAINTDTEAVNADSFLDIVASVVSIMIIMVLMTGLKIKNTPITVPALIAGSASSGEAGLAVDLAAEQKLRGEVMRVAGEVRDVQREALVREQERDALAVLEAALERQAAGAQQQLAAQSQEDAQRGQSIAEARARIAQLERERQAIVQSPAAPVQVECYPTPLSRAVEGHEVHFQLRRGRLAHVPLDSLVREFESDVQHKIYKVRDLPEMTEVVGPLEGFRLRYTVERVDVSPGEARATGRGGSYARLKRWTLIPVSDDLGETLDDAFKEGSQFRQVLASPLAKDSTVTIWTYPDSFQDFRRLKKELYRLGYPVAARPLPEGTPISGSPEGTKSAAE